MYTPLFIAFRCVFCSISQREYQQHEKIALKHFILKNWVKPIVSLALFIYDTIFSQKYLVVDLLHCNKIYISMRFDLCYFAPAFVVLEIALLSSIKIIVNTKSIKQRFLIIWTRHKSLDIFTVTRGLSTMTNLKKSYYDT